jgi:hypothetical protein
VNKYIKIQEEKRFDTEKTIKKSMKTSINGILAQKSK